MWQFEVPNAPCGVESMATTSFACLAPVVPNAPCGVESSTVARWIEESKRFLMHRVELKA